MAQAALPSIPVLYEDNHVIVIVKPVNVPTQEDDSHDPDLLTMIKQDLKHRHNKPGNVYLGLVHRLDRPVGGVMVFAKTSKAASRLSDAVRTRTIRKHYTAVINGKPKQPFGTLTHYLLKDTKTNMVSAVPPGKPGAKEAILDYRVIDHMDGLSLVNIELHTGRSHQIRVQFATIGCPLVGDQRYGAHLTKPGQQIALWSTELSFEHPVTKETLSFTSTPPAAFPWIMWNDRL
ncbi:RluA family pseudouridine synthase [Paenibacillus radicis (ex Xue et al. 2023)]|uniref:RNA pseudouridylate synthase n=1 Tax=Paenibacillus radicis (ex Xue et al. 2023) TaxID=2972489 RepID=A0ABT1YP88_9BACL|nr:RluA family pseudouridine synthase [Paenibacillus radicis (ex Xue et al. 2023)]MCR8634535.1 RluA family pseudouridine synthase [Paenibacillus radicis (ex Xue et al. 2023)]